MQKRYRVNHQIRGVTAVRLIDEQNQQIGVVPLMEALRTARERGLDLVEVSPVARPPVCRIVDYGRFTYQLDRQERKGKTRQKKVELKGVRLSLTIGSHDLQMLTVRARKFLDEGHRVKAEMLLRGRENQHRDRARVMLTEFAKSLGSDVKRESPVTQQGNRLSMLLSR